MNIEESMTTLSEILDVEGILKVKGINEVNHQPHQFTIGPKHLKHSAVNDAGAMSEETLEAIPCDAKDCGLLYSEHTAEKVVFLQLTRDTSQIEANDELIKIKSTLKVLGIDGVAFVESEEGYQFTTGLK